RARASSKQSSVSAHGPPLHSGGALIPLGRGAVNWSIGGCRSTDAPEKGSGRERHDAALEGLRDRFGAVRDAELAEDVADVNLHRALADREIGRNLAIA